MKEFLEAILDHDLEPNFRPKDPCRCLKVVKMLDSQYVQEQKMKMAAKETTQNNISMTVKSKDMQDPKQSRPPKPTGKIPCNSEWSDSEDGKDDQARAKPFDIQNPQPSTSYTSESAP